jgi:hypothetical protein
MYSTTVFPSEQEIKFYTNTHGGTITALHIFKERQFFKKILIFYFLPLYIRNETKKTYKIIKIPVFTNAHNNPLKQNVDITSIQNLDPATKITPRLFITKLT